jgi:hypothetical protein
MQGCTAAVFLCALAATPPAAHFANIVQGLAPAAVFPVDLMIVNLINGQSGNYDSVFLSNYATIFVKDELGRLPGVAGITYLASAITASGPGSILTSWRR